MAKMPEPGVLGSRKGKTKTDSALSSCGGGARPQAKDLEGHLKRLGEACAPASKMKPMGPVVRGAQADKDRHQEQRFRVDAGHCYRVYVAVEDAARDISLVLRDSAGDVVTTAAGAALPEDGAACFSTADEVTLLVGLGSGKATWAVQVWSD